MFQSVLLFILFSLLAVVGVCFLAKWLEKTFPGKKFDEMQTISRLKGYRLAFLVGFVYYLATVPILTGQVDGEKTIEPYLLVTGGFLLQAMVAYTYNLITHAAMPLGENPLGFGEMCERVNMSDWEGNQNVGDAIFGPSNWPQAAMMLTWTEIPGVYAVPSKGIVSVSDHVNAWLEDGKLMIQNPTQMDARVKVLVEEPGDMAQKLGLYWQDKFLIVHAAAGEKVCVKL